MKAKALRTSILGLDLTALTSTTHLLTTQEITLPIRLYFVSQAPRARFTSDRHSIPFTPTLRILARESTRPKKPLSSFHLRQERTREVWQQPPPASQLVPPRVATVAVAVARSDRRLLRSQSHPNPRSRKIRHPLAPLAVAGYPQLLPLSSMPALIVLI